MSAPSCPTCGYLMCEELDEQRISALVVVATPNGEYACRSGLCEETGAYVDCTVCGKRKGPRGRSAPLAMVNSLCDWQCPGYAQDPQVNDLWPGEKRWQFGYPKVEPKFPQPPGSPQTEGGGR